MRYRMQESVISTTLYCNLTASMHTKPSCSRCLAQQFKCSSRYPLLGLPESIRVLGYGLWWVPAFSRLSQCLISCCAVLQIIWVLPSLLGVALQYGTTNTGSRLFGYYIIGSFVGSVGQGFAFPGANVTGYTYVQNKGRSHSASSRSQLVLEFPSQETNHCGRDDIRCVRRWKSHR